MLDADAKRSQAPPGTSPQRDMIWIAAGTFPLGSDKHYPEEAPVHRVAVGGFFMDRTPVTNREFRKFVNATNYVTFAETRPDPKDLSRRLAAYVESGLSRLYAAGARGRSPQLE